jgi:hypothetical protein
MTIERLYTLRHNNKKGLTWDQFPYSPSNQAPSIQMPPLRTIQQCEII